MTHNTVFEALFAVQQNLPHVGKDNTADLGKFKYKYADLGAVQDALFPLFKEHGLVWTTAPRIVNDKFVLAWSLALSTAGGTPFGAVANDTISGEYPLPSGAPQDIGSALTYARRYALCAVTGLAPGGDDDDGAKASQPKPEPVSDVLVQEWLETITGADTLPALQAAWDGAGKAGVTRDKRVVDAKNARKKVLK